MDVEPLSWGDKVILVLGFIVTLAVWCEYLIRVLEGSI
jgi:hypothetical protein